MTYSYMVNTRGNRPVLVRVGDDNVYEKFSARDGEKWDGSKFLDALAYGSGDWVWYDDICEEEANEYMQKIREIDNGENN